MSTRGGRALAFACLLAVPASCMKGEAPESKHAPASAPPADQGEAAKGDREAESALEDRPAAEPFPGAAPGTVAAPPREEDSRDGDLDRNLEGGYGGVAPEGAAAPTRSKAKKSSSSRSGRATTPDKDPAADSSTAESKASPAPALADPSGFLTELTRLEDEMARAGVVLPSARKRVAANQGPAVPAEPNCEQVCRLTEAICELEARICSLAGAHPEDDRYRNACARASGDCDAASAACERCGG